jgi:protein-S-isoprenylcysteine O-methyltransferase Ste14
MDRTFKALYFLGMLVEMAIRLPHERRRRRERVAVDRVSEPERPLLGLMFLGMLFVPAVQPHPLAGPGELPLVAGSRGRAGGIGAVVLAAAVWLFWRSHADLGRNWSPSLQLHEGHELVTGGVYRWIRHPMYASQWVWGVAQALLLRNRISGWSGLVLFAPLYLSRVPREEQMMLEQFGEAYRAYMSRTGRVFPPARELGFARTTGGSTQAR